MRCSFAKATVADAVVARDDSPAAASYGGEPLFVDGVLLEVVVVDFDGRARCSQCCSDDVLADAPVDQEDWGHAARRRFWQRMASSTSSRRMP